MFEKNPHTNIMLDLECTKAEASNPVLLQIGAVFFDIDTGEQFKTFSSSVNFQSCLDHGLLTDYATSDGLWKDNSMNFVRRFLPNVLKASRESESMLPDVLSEFSKWIKLCCDDTRRRLKAQGLNIDSQPQIWGNGASGDNVWIKEAYLASKMNRPSQFYNDRCVRTFMQQNKHYIGIDYFKTVVFEGTKHHAVDDCKHQIKYVVLAHRRIWEKMGIWSAAPSCGRHPHGADKCSDFLSAAPSNDITTSCSSS